MDRLEEWRVFATVATPRASRRRPAPLGRSPQAVTRAVAALEARLGTRLLHRTTRSVSLTHDGERYLERAAARSPSSTRSRRRSTRTRAARHARDHRAGPVRSAARHADRARVSRRAPRTSTCGSRCSIAWSRSRRRASTSPIRIGELPGLLAVAPPVGHVRTVVVASPAYLDARRHAAHARGARQARVHRVVRQPRRSPIAGRSVGAASRSRRASSSTPRRPRSMRRLGGLGLARVLSYQVDRLLAAGKLRDRARESRAAAVPVHLVHLPGVQPRAAIAFAELAATALRKRL